MRIYSDRNIFQEWIWRGAWGVQSTDPPFLISEMQYEVEILKLGATNAETKYIDEVVLLPNKDLLVIHKDWRSHND